MIKCEAYEAFYRFFATSIIVKKHENKCKIFLSNDIKITLKSHFWHQNLNILSNVM